MTQMNEVMRWDSDDAISHDPVHMLDDITLDLISI